MFGSGLAGEGFDWKEKRGMTRKGSANCLKRSFLVLLCLAGIASAKDEVKEVRGELLSAEEEVREGSITGTTREFNHLTGKWETRVNQSRPTTFFLLEVATGAYIYRVRYRGDYLPWAVGDSLRLVTKKNRPYIVLPGGDTMVEVKMIMKRKAPATLSQPQPSVPQSGFSGFCPC
jgi:hypothetical protein